jgi:hypothetical protein
MTDVKRVFKVKGKPFYPLGCDLFMLVVTVSVRSRRRMKPSRL